MIAAPKVFSWQITGFRRFYIFMRLFPFDHRIVFFAARQLKMPPFAVDSFKTDGSHQFFQQFPVVDFFRITRVEKILPRFFQMLVKRLGFPLGQLLGKFFLIAVDFGREFQVASLFVGEAAVDRRTVAVQAVFRFAGKQSFYRNQFQNPPMGVLEQ